MPKPIQNYQTCTDVYRNQVTVSNPPLDSYQKKVG